MKLFLKYNKRNSVYDYNQETTVEDVMEFAKGTYSLDQCRLLYCGSQLKSGILVVKENSTVLVMGTPSILQQYRVEFEELESCDLKPIVRNELLVQLLLKVDSVQSTSEQERARRKELVQDIQRVLDSLGFN
jgi:hypothetical protein